MQNDGHRDLIVFHSHGSRLMQADREATDTDCVAPGAGKRFTIFPVAESTRVHKLFSVVAPGRLLGLEISVRIGCLWWCPDLDPAKLQDRQVAEEAEKHMKTVSQLAEPVGIKGDDLSPRRG